MGVMLVYYDFRGDIASQIGTHARAKSKQPGQYTSETRPTARLLYRALTEALADRFALYGPTECSLSAALTEPFAELCERSTEALWRSQSSASRSASAL